MIGYYVHHHGLGHLQRLRCLLPDLRTPVTVLSSLPEPSGWTGSWVELPPDDDGSPTGDVTAHDRLHWVPPRHNGLRGRMARIAEWVDRVDPALMVVDVSMEVTVLTRLMGVPTMIVGMPGNRTDPAHRLGYDLADAIVVPWPRTVSTGWPAAWRDKSCFVGAFSRYDHAVPGRDTRRSPGRRVTLLMGKGGVDIGRPDVDAAVAETPAWSWSVLGGPAASWQPEPWAALRSADVVVTHAGQNAIAEVAAARAPAVVVPQQRPYGEQHATARALAQLDCAVVVDRWPAPEHWPRLFADALGRGGQAWSCWSTGVGASRAAEFIERMAARPAAS